jgi:hypothetical protein
VTGVGPRGPRAFGPSAPRPLVRLPIVASRRFASTLTPSQAVADRASRQIPRPGPRLCAPPSGGLTLRLLCPGAPVDAWASAALRSREASCRRSTLCFLLSGCPRGGGCEARPTTVKLSRGAIRDCSGRGMRDAGCGMRDAGCGMRDTILIEQRSNFGIRRPTAVRGARPPSGGPRPSAARAPPQPGGRCPAQKCPVSPMLAVVCGVVVSEVARPAPKPDT